MYNFLFCYFGLLNNINQQNEKPTLQNTIFVCSVLEYNGNLVILRENQGMFGISPTILKSQQQSTTSEFCIEIPVD